ncbi:hypothetical protein [Nocardia tengchongensis]|uniref:hypothetical protein n=1 Tax=Nocardia tengchongensis TaxID=2055889 RepID=UPI003607FE00
MTKYLMIAAMLGSFATAMGVGTGTASADVDICNLPDTFWPVPTVVGRVCDQGGLMGEMPPRTLDDKWAALDWQGKCVRIDNDPVTGQQTVSPAC